MPQLRRLTLYSASCVLYAYEYTALTAHSTYVWYMLPYVQRIKALSGTCPQWVCKSTLAEGPLGVCGDPGRCWGKFVLEG